LERLDEYARRHDVGKMCTLVYAELDLAEGALRFASAGHPPPLLMEPGEEPRFAWGGRSTPLDAFAAHVDRAEAAEPLRRGSTVLLYTDGLVEERSHALDYGMERLRGAVAAHRNEPASAILEGLVRIAPASPHPDDTCALVARIAA
jgi:serine phosphatase RsbU (regulator of sigma subunit)